MQLERYFPIQKGLDDTILKEKGLEEKPRNIYKLLALMVEIGEMANETRCFKYWSEKPPSKKEIILEEFVDCMHFLLGIGNDYGYSVSFMGYRFIPKENDDLPTEIFSFYESVVTFKGHSTISNYMDIWDRFFQIALLLGFSSDDINKAYFRKNRENFERQSNGY